MKLKKENIYINLQGKSTEYCGKVYDILNANGEKTYVSKIKMHIYSNGNGKYHLSDGIWTDGDPDEAKGKQEVTIQQLKEILQPMGNKEFDLRGYSVEVDNEGQAKKLQELAFKQGFKWYDGEKVCLLDRKFFNFNAFNKNMIHFDTIHFKDEYVTKEIHFNDIFKTELTLTEQLEKAEAEVERLQKAIEEDNKIKVGDWCLYSRKSDNYIAKYDDDTESYGILKCSKITDQELINKLNELIK